MKGVYVGVHMRSILVCANPVVNPLWKLYLDTNIQLSLSNNPVGTSASPFPLPFSCTCSLPFHNKMNRATTPSRGLLFLDTGQSPRRKSSSNVNTFWYKEHLFRHS